jgi:hypothetical protein
MRPGDDRNAFFLDQYNLPIVIIDTVEATLTFWNGKVPFPPFATIIIESMAAPALCPIAVTFSGSPPNFAIYFFVHSKAATLSCSPALASILSFAEDTHPYNPILSGLSSAANIQYSEQKNQDQKILTCNY